MQRRRTAPARRTRRSESRLALPQTSSSCPTCFEQAIQGDARDENPAPNSNRGNVSALRCFVAVVAPDAEQFRSFLDLIRQRLCCFSMHCVLSTRGGESHYYPHKICRAIEIVDTHTFLCFSPRASRVVCLMQSLKTFLPILSKLIDVRPDQAYERQRLMVKAGILRAREGRGPGSGVAATGKNVALLLVALLVGEFRDRAISSVRSVANARPLSECPVNGNATFAEAIAGMIEAGFPNFLDWPSEIVVQRDTLCGEIRWEADALPSAIFYPAHKKSLDRRRFHVDGILAGHSLLKIRNALVFGIVEGEKG